MKKNLINTTHIEGILYQHNLEAKVSGQNSKNPGTPFINGTIDIATNDALTNIVQVHFTYVTEVTSRGKVNSTYTVLSNIINGKIGNYMEHGAEGAAKVSVNSAIGLNEFYTDRNGEETLISTKRNEGGFVSTVNALNEKESNRNTFECDILINKVTEVEPNEEKGIEAKVNVGGYIFDFRGQLLPVEFSATSPGAMSYFLGLDASNSNPCFTKVWGKQVSETIVTKIVSESAFGEDAVKEVPKSRKDFVITGAARDPYIWDDEAYITAAELKELIANRETTLATLKQRQAEYKAAKAAATASATIATPKAGDFVF